MGDASFVPPKELEGRLYINGEFVPSISGKKFDIYNPHTEKLSGSVFEAGAEDVDKAVAAAKAAFPAWSELGAAERGAWINKLADAVEKALPEISYSEAISMGKPAHNDIFSSIAISAMRYFAGKSMDVSGDTSLNTAGMVNMSFRQPFGVCGAIIPWNVTLAMCAMKVAPALITGNTLVLKSSEKSPFSPIIFARCAHEIGLPKGVLNIVAGYGRPTGEAIAKHMDIRKISFTGSAIAGRAVKKAAAESNLKNVTLELGGKSPLLIFEDADLAKAVPAAAFSIVANSGQACIASSRVYVHEKIAPQFIESMKGAMAQIGKSADPLAEGTLRGPQADKIQFDRVMGYLDLAKKEGINMALGGGREGTEGYYVEPTIMTNAPENSRVMKEEIFGPVVAINTFTDEEEVLKRANDTEYGLYSSVFTKDISRALRVAKKLEAGSVGVNCTSPTMAYDMPFGGFKASGDGRELSRYAMDYWTELKSVFISL